LVTDPHGVIIGELERQPSSDLLGAPSLHPPPVTAMRLVLALPLRSLRTKHLAIIGGDPPREPVLDVVTQPVVGGQFRHLGSPRPPLSVPLGERRLVLEPERPGRRVAAQLSANRRRRPADPPCDLSHAMALGPIQGNVLALGKGQV